MATFVDNGNCPRCNGALQNIREMRSKARENNSDIYGVILTFLFCMAFFGIITMPNDNPYRFFIAIFLGILVILLLFVPAAWIIYEKKHEEPKVNFLIPSIGLFLGSVLLTGLLGYAIIVLQIGWITTIWAIYSVIVYWAIFRFLIKRGYYGEI